MVRVTNALGDHQRGALWFLQRSLSGGDTPTEAATAAVPEQGASDEHSSTLSQCGGSITARALG